MILKRRLLDALTSRTVKRWLSQASWIAPGGTIDSSVNELIRTTPNMTASGNETLPTTMIAAKTVANWRRHGRTQPML